MKRYTASQVFLVTSILASFAQATDFKCDDTAATMVSLPPELRIETSMASILRLAGDSTPQVHSLVSKALPPLSLVRWLQPPDEVQVAAEQDIGKGLNSKEVPTLRDKFNPLGAGVKRSPGYLVESEPLPQASVQEPRQKSPHELAPHESLRRTVPITRVVDRNTGEVAAGLKHESTSPTFNVLKDAFREHATCTATVVGDWEELDDTIKAKGFLEPPEALARAYYLDKAKFIKDHDSSDVAKFLAYLKATRTLLDKCFVAAENTAFELKHKALGQIGRLTYGINAECTATVIGDGRYLITARHCFKPLVNAPSLAKDMWFKPAGSENRYAVCAIAEKDALLPEKIASIDFDQVLVRIASTGVTPRPIKLAALSQIMTTADEKIGSKAAPTLLVNMSYFPLAPLVYPEKFSSGYVSATAVCAATAKAASCFSHICGAVAGGSGSPIFEANAKDITLVGTHVGGSADVGSLVSRQTECRPILRP